MITLTFPDGTTREYHHAVTHARRRELHKRMYRSPYGSTWRTEGSGKPLPETVGVTIELYEGGLVFGANPSQETSFTLVAYAGSQVTYLGGNLTYSVDQEPSGAAAVLMDDAENAVELSTPYWTADLEGVTSTVMTPVAGGYRVRIEWLAQRPATFP